MKIISTFPGVGKTHLSNNPGKNLLVDSDSYFFYWSINAQGIKTRHPDFPSNYISHIKLYKDILDYMLISSHKRLRNALSEAQIPYTLVYPYFGCKEEYRQRYIKRGSPDSFINIIMSNWDKWMEELREQKGCTHIELPCDTYLSDYLNRL